MAPTCRNFAPCLLLLLALPLGAVETYEQVLRRTDMANAASVYLLAEWCQENNQPTRARQYLSQVVRLDKDHAEARAALGHVRVGERWMAKSQVATAANGDAGERKSAGGPAPTAAKVAWPLTVPTDPAPDNTFVDTYIEQLQQFANDSSEMELAISTLVTGENLPMALPRTCAALLKPSFTDLYGPSEMIQLLLKDGRRSDAQTLFPFVAAASVRITDPEDLAAFCAAAGYMGDKRAVPRLIELMRATDATVAETATVGAAAITGLPREGLSPERVNTWWGRFHEMDDNEILLVQLKSKESDTALAAAERLGIMGEKRALDELITWMRSDDVKVAAKAHRLVTQFTDRDWAFTPTDPPDQRAKRVEVLAKWWKENRDSFTLIVDPRLTRGSVVVAAGGPALDPLRVAVRDLGSTDTKVAVNAGNTLGARGEEAVLALIEGLSSPDLVTARRSHELLQRSSGKSDIAFDPRDDAGRQAAIDAWRAWATTKNLLPKPLEEVPEEDTQPAE